MNTSVGRLRRVARCKVIHDVEKKAEWSFKEKEKQMKQLGLIKILSSFSCVLGQETLLPEPNEQRKRLKTRHGGAYL